jgi:undecaprenyl-diphosphatase
MNGWGAAYDGLEDPLRFFAMYGQYFFAALLALLFLVQGKWRSISGRHAVVAAGFSALLALGIAHLFAEFVARPRPYVTHPSAHLFIPRTQDTSFPSDHATAAFAIAVALLLRHRKAGLLALGMAVVLSVARVIVGTHYPCDVLAGAAVGTAAALVFWHPSVREPLHRAAEWSGSLYERATQGLRSPGARAG